MAKVATPPRKPSSNPLMIKVREFISYKKQIDKLSKAQDEIKKDLMQTVEEMGEVDDSGHQWLHLPEEVDGYASLQRQRRVSQKLDMDAAEEILKKKGLYDKCVTMVPMIEEDAVMGALYLGELTEEEVDQIFPKTITWAFVPKKA